jgi:hypothetical protein
VAHVRFELVDSPLVAVSKAWLERKDGQLLLRGYVLRRPETKDTSATCLEVALLSESGTVLRVSQENFEPRQIRRLPRMPDSASFKINLGVWPAQASRISIRAHEGSRPSSNDFAAPTSLNMLDGNFRD